jgi:hypothetical protein
MMTQESTEQVLWMADCYSLAKRFPNPQTWLALLEPTTKTGAKNFNAFQYWLWMEIWKVANGEEEDKTPTLQAKSP